MFSSLLYIGLIVAHFFADQNDPVSDRREDEADAELYKEVSTDERQEYEGDHILACARCPTLDSWEEYGE